MKEHCKKRSLLFSFRSLMSYVLFSEGETRNTFGVWKCIRLHNQRKNLMVREPHVIVLPVNHISVFYMRPTTNT